MAPYTSDETLWVLTHESPTINFIIVFTALEFVNIVLAFYSFLTLVKFSIRFVQYGRLVSWSRISLFLFWVTMPHVIFSLFSQYKLIIIGKTYGVV